MESFNRYLDKIKAEEYLTDNTKLFLREKLTESESKNQKYRALSKHRFFLFDTKKRTAFSGAIVAVIILISGYLIYQRPVAYVSMDINPSIEMELNLIDRVVGINIFNEDSVKMMEGESVLNLKSQKAIEVIIVKACELGYVNNDGSSVVSIMAITDNEKRSVKLNNQLSNSIQISLKKRNAFATSFSGTSGIEARIHAEKMGVSVGKYKLIKALENIDPSIKAEDYKNMKISEILDIADELANENEHPEQLDKATRDIIKRVRATSAEVRRNRERARDKGPKDNPKPGKNTNKP